MITFFGEEKHKGLEFVHPCFAIELEIYGSQVGVFFDKRDVQTISKTLAGIDIDMDQFDDTANGQAGILFDEDQLPYYYILYNTDPKKGVGAGLVSHECVHCAMFICDNKGVKVEVDYDEPFAYMVDYLVESVVEGLSIIEEDKVPSIEKPLIREYKMLTGHVDFATGKHIPDPVLPKEVWIRIHGDKEDTNELDDSS